MMKMEQKHYPQRGHKPSSKHPWKNTKILNSEQGAWAREQSTYAHVENYKVGGGKPQK